MNRQEIIVKEQHVILGKISSASFGFGGYQDSMIGLSLSFRGGSFGVSDFKGGWQQSIEVTEHTKWSEADRSDRYAEAVRLLDDTLRKAKKQTVNDLVGVPVELTFKDYGSILESWRVLEEVL